MKTTLLQAAVALMAIIGLVACDHKDLCYDHPHTKRLQVRFDWSEAADATPEGMCVYFYPADDTGGARRFDISGRMGAEIDLAVGRYRVLCYNNDTEAVLTDGIEGYFTHHAYTREGDLLESIYGSATTGGRNVPRAAEAADERVVISPDMMWGCSEGEIEVTDTPEGETQIITLTPHSLVHAYNFKLTNVKNLSHVSRVCASLSGMAGGLNLSTGTVDTECVTIPFAVKADGESALTGTFYAFGCDAANIRSHHLSLYVVMDDGKKYVYGTTGQHFNVTNALHSAADGLNVNFTVDGLDLPQPITDAGGMKPSVDDWVEVDEEIGI